jgi:uncharacterized membrane protein YdbT with pleckstrin-like domain
MLLPLSNAGEKSGRKELHRSLRRQIPIRFRKIVKQTLSFILRLCLFGAAAYLLLNFLIATKAVGEIQQETVWSVRLWFAGLLLTLVLSKMLYHTLHFSFYFYDLRDGTFIVRKGVIAKREAILPLSRITDVWVDRDISDVLFGLYDVHISTPTIESGVFAHVSGVDRRGAAKLRRLLIDQMGKMRSLEQLS